MSPGNGIGRKKRDLVGIAGLLLVLAVVFLAVGGMALAFPDDAGRDPFVPLEPLARERPEITVTREPSRDPFAPADMIPLDPDAEIPRRVSWMTRDPFDRELPEPSVAEPPVQAPVTGETSIAIVVVTNDRCWLDAYEDDRQVLRTNVPGGSTLTFAGVREIRFEQVGRDWAIAVSVNGQDLGLLVDISEGLVDDPLELDTPGARVRITLERWFPSGVLVGLRFVVVE